MSHPSWARRAALGAGFCLVALLGACGGGGGGGGGGGDGSSARQVSFDTSSLSFETTEGFDDGSSIAVINASASGVGDDDEIYVGAVIEGQGIKSPVQVNVNAAARTAAILVQADGTLPAGTYSGQLHLLACNDPVCNSHVRGSPHTVNFTTTIKARLKATASAVAFAAPEQGVSDAQVLAVTKPADMNVTAAVAYVSGGPAGWLSVVPDDAGFRLQAATGSLRPGTYRAILSLAVADARQDIQIPVTLNVGSGLLVQAGLDLRITSASTASERQGEVPVQPAPGVTVAGWAASSNVPWLVVDTPGGSPGDPARWHLDPRQFASLANQQVHEGSLTIVGAGLSAQTVAVRLDKEVAEIAAIDRLAVLAGEAGEVLLYGDNFDQLAAPLQNLSISGAAATSAQRLSSRLISVQMPGLAAGDYAVSLTTLSGLPTRSTTLQVLQPQERGYQAVATEGTKGAAVWDAASQTLFVVNQTLGSLMGFRLGGTVGTPTAAVISRSLPSLSNIALGRDGSLLALVAPDTLLTLSKQDLSTLRTRRTGAAAYQAVDTLPLAVTGEDKLWYASGAGWNDLAVYDLVHDKLELVQGSSYSFYAGPWAGVSGNGQRMLMPQSGSISPAPPMLRRDALDGVLSAFPSSAAPKSFFRYSSDRRGKRWLLEGVAVHDFDLGIEGRIELPADWYGVQSAMSRDGTRAYVYALHSSAIGTYSEPSPILRLPRVYVFDTSSPATTSTSYPVLDYIELADYSSCRASQGPTACHPYGSFLFLSADDRTLMVVGDRRLVVAPVPASLRGGVLPAQALQMSRGLGGR